MDTAHKIKLFIPHDFIAIEWPYELTECDIMAEVIVVDPQYPVKDLNKFPRLQLVVSASTGTDHIDKIACAERKITVLSLLDNRSALDEIRASSELTFMLILNALRRLDRAVCRGRWHRNEDGLRGHELYNKMVGLVGHGRIGQNLEHWCRAFGAGVYWRDPYDDSNLFQPSIEWLFRNSHIIVVCCGYDQLTRGMIGKDLLSSMLPNACLINTARGGIIREYELVEVAKKRPDLTFCLDVLEDEGEEKNTELLVLPNVVITPHIAGTTYESQTKAAQIAAKLIEEFYEGKRDEKRFRPEKRVRDI